MPSHCPHKTIHTERLMSADSPSVDKINFVIITYCADCGKKLKEVLIQDEVLNN